MNRSSWHFPLLGVALLLLTAGGLAVYASGEQGLESPGRTAWFVAVCLAACLVYLIACRGFLWPEQEARKDFIFGHAEGVLLARQKQQKTFAVRVPASLHQRPGAPPLTLVLGVALLLRLIVLVAPSFLSTDLYRYVWDGRVQLAGINPYLYIPAAPELAFLRDDQIFTRLNRPDYALTIYPPVAQMIFRAVASVWQSPYAIKAAMALFDAMTILILLRLLAMAGRPAAQVMVYAWHPLPAWEFAGNAHVDAAAICFIALAALPLAAATLVKLLPLVLLPVIWRRPDGSRTWFLVPLLFLFAIAGAYLCFAGAGWQVLGFLPGYAAEEGVRDGSGLYPLALLSWLTGALPPWAGTAYLGAVAVALLALGARIGFADRKLAGAALLLSGALTLALSPHYPWYFVWLLLPCCLVPCLSVMYLTTAAFLIYLASYGSNILWPSLLYLPFLMLAARDLTRLSTL